MKNKGFFYAAFAFLVAFLIILIIAVTIGITQEKDIVAEDTGFAPGKLPKIKSNHPTQQAITTPPSLGEGEKIYNQYCAACHNGNYQGAPKVGDKQAWQPIIEKGMPALLFDTIAGYKDMPMRGSCEECSDSQLLSAIVYMVQDSKTRGDYLLWLGLNPAQAQNTVSTPLAKEDLIQKGQQIYNSTCAVCHKPDGSGTPPAFPALKGDSIVTGPIANHIAKVLNGVPNTAMRAFKNELSPEQIAEVITYERNSWGNDDQTKFGKNAGGVAQPKDVAQFLNGNQPKPSP